MSSKWKCCIKEPSETGKKVLCQRKGDLYLAVRMKNYYLPFPFVDHYHCKDLCFPETWCEIDFPEGLTGHFRIMLPPYKDLITFSELEVDYPEVFNNQAKHVISLIGKLKNPYSEETSE